MPCETESLSFDCPIIEHNYSERLTDGEAAQASSDCAPPRREVATPSYCFHWVLQVELAFAAALSGVFLVSTLRGAALFLIQTPQMSSPPPAEGDVRPLFFEEASRVAGIQSLPGQCRCCLHVGQTGVCAVPASMPDPAV